MLKDLFTNFRRSPAVQLEKVRIAIQGMTCGKCAQTLTKALMTKAGVGDVSIDRKGGVATVGYDPARVDVPMLYEIITRKGYFPSAAADAES